MGLLVGFILVTLLHFSTILKKISFTFHIRDYVKTFLIMAVSGWTGHGCSITSRLQCRPFDEGIARNPRHQHSLHPHASASRIIT